MAAASEAEDTEQVSNLEKSDWKLCVWLLEQLDADYREDTPRVDWIVKWSAGPGGLR